jgi:hypothetical protein
MQKSQNSQVKKYHSTRLLFLTDNFGYNLSFGLSNTLLLIYEIHN